MNKEILFYNLCEEGLSYRMIDKAIASGITIDNIKNMNINEFANLYGVKKADLYNALRSCALSYENYESLSIYGLMYTGISNNIVEGLIDKGLTKVLQLVLMPEDYVKTKYNITDLKYERLIEALEKLEYADYVDFDSKDAQNIIQMLDGDTLYQTYLKKEILKVVNESNKDILMYTDILINLPEGFKHSESIFYAIQELAFDKKLEFTECGIKKYGYTLDEFIESIKGKDERTKLFINEYLGGKTYEQIGQENGDISRERVRQIISKIDFPVLSEDKYFEYFEKYDLDEENFTKVFDIDSKVYRYFTYKCKKREWRSIDELIENPDTPSEIKAKLQVLNPKCVYINDKKVSKNMTSILRYYFTRYFSEPIKAEKLFEEFSLFWEDVVGEKMDREVRTFIHAVEHMDCSVLTHKKGWRYYDINNYDVNELFDKLDLNEFDNKEVNSKIIYDAHKDLMIEYDVRDHYELHSLMKKSGKFDYIDFGRIPILKLGSCDRDQQIIDLLIELSPVTTSDFCDEYHRRYGADKNTLTSYLIANFGKYYNNHVLDISTPLISDLEVYKWQKLLDKDFYMHDDIKNIAIANNLSFDTYLFKRVNLNKIGFISNGAYIFRDKYKYVNSYFQSLFVDDIIDISSFDRRMLNLVAFTDVLYTNIRNMQIFEFANRKYIRIEKLNEMNVTKEKLIEFSNKVRKFTKGNCFTIQSIINEGFDDELLDLGFDNLFYASVLVSTNQFSFRRIQNTGEFILRDINAGQQVSLSDLINQEVCKNRYIYVYDLIEILNEHFGLIRYDVFKIKTHICDTEMYYDNVSENVYCDYDTYFNLI